MSFHAYSYATTKDTGKTALQMTLYVIACHVNVETGQTYCSIRTLMNEAKVKSDRTMRNYLSELEDLGFIRRHKRTRENGSNTSDALELVGFLEWNAIRCGQPAKVVDDPAKITGGVQNVDKQGTVRQKLPGAPVVHELPGPPVVHELPDQNIPLNNLEQRAGAREPGDGSLALASRVALVLTPVDVSWPAWIEHLNATGHDGLAERAETAQQMTVSKRWPEGDAIPLPKIPRSKAPITDRMIGEARQ